MTNRRSIGGKARKPDQAAGRGSGGAAAMLPPCGIDFVDGRLPEGLRAGIERLSGFDLSDVRVHAGSGRPAQLHALAYAQDDEIHLAPGQERHLPHEAWHVVQQRQGRVKPTLRAKGIAINDDPGLEREADAMGERAAAASGSGPAAHAPSLPSAGLASGAPAQLLGDPELARFLGVAKAQIRALPLRGIQKLALEQRAFEIGAEADDEIRAWALFRRELAEETAGQEGAAPAVAGEASDKKDEKKAVGPQAASAGAADAKTEMIGEIITRHTDGRIATVVPGKKYLIRWYRDGQPVATGEFGWDESTGATGWIEAKPTGQGMGVFIVYYQALKLRQGQEKIYCGVQASTDSRRFRQRLGFNDVLATNENFGMVADTVDVLKNAAPNVSGWTWV